MKQLKDCTPTESCNRPNIFCAYPDCARGEAKNAIKKTPTVEDQQAEITRLKEQLARTERERDQATTWLIIDEKGEIWSRARGQWARVGNKDTDPELFAHLAGKVEG